MRINARRDDEAQQQVHDLTQATGQRVSQVVREAVARYCTETRAMLGGMRHFAKLVGQGDSGRSAVASNYKQLMPETLAARHGLGPR